MALSVKTLLDLEFYRPTAGKLIIGDQTHKHSVTQSRTVINKSLYSNLDSKCINDDQTILFYCLVDGWWLMVDGSLIVVQTYYLI